MKDKKVKLQKFLSLFLALIMLCQIPLTSFNIYATENTDTSIENSETSDESLTEEVESNEIINSEENSSSNDIAIISEENEENTDNWELSIVFYDSSVDSSMVDSEGNYNSDGRKTALSEINWDASDEGCGVGDTRIITLQINYKNTKTTMTYDPNELKISIHNFVYRKFNDNLISHNNRLWTGSILVGANDSTHTGYDWDFITASSPNSSQETFTFANKNTITSGTSFEGSIQIVYILTPIGEVGNWGDNLIERYDDECIHELSTLLQANLSYVHVLEDLSEETINIYSNELLFNYTRTYIHPWEYEDYTIRYSHSKISSYDNLCNNPDAYIWVKQLYYGQPYNETANYPDLHALDSTAQFINDSIPSECVVIDFFGNILTPVDGAYVFDNSMTTNESGTGYYIYIYVGYPKSIYNEENNNMIVTNNVELSFILWYVLR